EFLCLHLGEQLPHSNWHELAGSRWYKAIDQSIQSAGVPATVLSIDHLTARGSPVPIPKYTDGPSIGYLKRFEIDKALTAFRDANVPNEKIDEYAEDIRGWLQNCADSKRDLICFCSDNFTPEAVDLEVPRPAAKSAQTAKRRFEFSDAGSNKFWEIVV